MNMQLEMFTRTNRFDAWKAFHRDNPAVFGLFRRFAMEALNKGRRRLGARMIGERIRWHTGVETIGDEFKINDHFWPYYSRLLAGLDDRFKTFFTFKDDRFDATRAEIVAYHRSLS